jgi:hypothetical protein
MGALCGVPGAQWFVNQTADGAATTAEGTLRGTACRVANLRKRTSPRNSGSPKEVPDTSTSSSLSPVRHRTNATSSRGKGCELPALMRSSSGMKTRGCPNQDGLPYDRAARLQPLDNGAPVSEYTGTRELGPGGCALVPGARGVRLLRRGTAPLGGSRISGRTVRQPPEGGAHQPRLRSRARGDLAPPSAPRYRAGRPKLLQDSAPSGNRTQNPFHLMIAVVR